MMEDEDEADEGGRPLGLSCVEVGVSFALSALAEFEALLPGFSALSTRSAPLAESARILPALSSLSALDLSRPLSLSPALPLLSPPALPPLPPPAPPPLFPELGTPFSPPAAPAASAARASGLCKWNRT
ncbi:hypothetical protein M427DRAFT_51592 [Gonapodya prolifera JEL478]|uniref:Uncharacterized protein n=1 Tax=Gonapodya prolifera (strain JEL478) TaxID=1344416 RepID=A0A139AX98_GONPJ|nr:hypothetical protein M427DRAFT_51592 [Gonapodya prolifera JEL478]|eukprot:KXS21366.1 hypothetical protein M427DRAFT_51592 [Gonapodya prolifera JEL478]